MRSAILSLISLLAMTACSLERVQMAQSPALARIVPMQVSQASFPARKAPLSFGSWQTQGLYKDFEKLRCRANPVLAKATAVGRFRFALTEPQAGMPPVNSEQVLRAECVMANRTTIYRALGDVYADLDGYPQLECDFEGLDSGKLEITHRRGQPEVGSATFTERAWKVRAVTRAGSRQSSAERPFGYEIVAGDEVIAAVEIINSGRVWMQPALANDVRLAALATALLLYDPREIDPEDCP